MAIKLQWKELVDPVDAIDAEVKQSTGVSLREKIALRKRCNPMTNEQLFVETPYGFLPVKAFKRIY